jgi:hypothetical protein
MERQHVLTAYAQAWAHQEEQTIRDALGRCWTDSSVYVSPLTDLVRGIEGLTNLILDFPVMFPGATVRATSDWDIHHDVAYFTWQLSSTAPIRTLGRDFGKCLNGVDFVEFEDDGRIRRINAFFGFDPAQEASAEAASAARFRQRGRVDLDDAERADDLRTEGAKAG